MKVLVLGASGMLGNAMLQVLAEYSGWDVFGTVRSDSIKESFPLHMANKLISGVDVNNTEVLSDCIKSLSPDVVINCVGVTKHLPNADDPLVTIPINALLPHQLAKICAETGSRVVHISTDCVFSGLKGNYNEQDKVDATDLYGLSKYLGELHSENCITLRTSIIGHELTTRYGLLEWFLSQKGSCKGFTHAIFSGLPTVILAQIVHDIVIPRPDLKGLYHVAAKPISKYDLLKIIATVYKKNIEIIPDDNLVIDRSLNSDYFVSATGYSAPEWPDLIASMYSYHKKQDEEHV